jgi:hypothetical protein
MHPNTPRPVPSDGALAAYRVLTTATGAAAIHEMITRRAYLIWRSRGCPTGTSFEDWLQAEKEVAEEIRRGRRSHPKY